MCIIIHAFRCFDVWRGGKKKREKGKKEKKKKTREKTRLQREEEEERKFDLFESKPIISENDFSSGTICLFVRRTWTNDMDW